MCKFGSQVCQAFTPQRRFPQLGPWHHVGVTMEITLDKNGSLYDPAGTESWNMQIRYETHKLTMHPTNNGSSPEWSPCPESTSQRIEQNKITRIVVVGDEIGEDYKTKHRRWVGEHVWWIPKGCSDCGDRVNLKKWWCWGTWLSPLPSRWKIAGTSSWPSWISHFTGSFVGHSPSEMLCPPAFLMGNLMIVPIVQWRNKDSQTKREVLHLFRCFTHTHTHIMAF